MGSCIFVWIVNISFCCNIPFIWRDSTLWFFSEVEVEKVWSRMIHLASPCHATHSLNRNKQSYSWSLSFDLRQMATHLAKRPGADNVTLFSSLHAFWTLEATGGFDWRTRLSRVSWWEEPVSIGWWVKLQWVLFPNATLLHGVSIPSCQGSPSVDPMPVQEYAWMVLWSGMFERFWKISKLSDLHHLSFSFWDVFSYQLKALTWAFRRIKRYELPPFPFLPWNILSFATATAAEVAWVSRRSSSRTSIMAIQKFIIPVPETEHWLYRIDLKQFGLWLHISVWYRLITRWLPHWNGAHMHANKTDNMLRERRMREHGWEILNSRSCR